MATLETVNDTPSHHLEGAGIPTGEAECPYCGQPISRKGLKQIRARIEAEERDRIAGVERSLREKFAREKAQAEATAKAAVEKAQREAGKAAEQRVKTLIANQEAIVARRLLEQREVLDKARVKAVADEKANAYQEKLALEQQLQVMQRRLQQKTAHALGEPAEVDLFDALKAAAFPDDRISRVAKGRRGPDVVLEIVHGGAVIGSIIVDSKNHARWSNAFSKKLRSDQLASGAEFAVLSSSVFPAASGQQHLLLHEGVIVARPALVPVLVSLLRRQIVENHRLRLAGEGRNEKATTLLAYIASPACADLLDRIVRLTADLGDLDARETTVHTATWKKRADLINGVRGAHDAFAAEVASIIAGEAQ